MDGTAYTADALQGHAARRASCANLFEERRASQISSKIGCSFAACLPPSRLQYIKDPLLCTYAVLLDPQQLHWHNAWFGLSETWRHTPRQVGQ